MGGQRDPDQDLLSTLSPREREVAIAVGQGSSTADIARGFEISIRTVESHVWHLYRKLGVHNRVELVRWLLRQGLVDIDGRSRPPESIDEQ